MDGADGSGCVTLHPQLSLFNAERTHRDGRVLTQNFWVVDPGQVTFLCAAKEKSPKERPPRMAQTAVRSSCFGAPALSRRDFLSRGPVACIPACDPFGALHPKALRCSAAPYGDPTAKNPNRSRCAGMPELARPNGCSFVFSPRSRRRASQPKAEKARQGARRERARACDTGIVPSGAPRLRREAQEESAAPGGLSLCLLSLGQARESRPTAVREPQLLISYSTDAPAGRSTARW
jgi:hypothetical protein